MCSSDLVFNLPVADHSGRLKTYPTQCELLMDGAQLWQTLIQGVVQGITEFLPISSKSHLILVGGLLDRWFGTSSTATETVELIVGLHLGTLVATIVVYWKELWSLRTRRSPLGCCR